MSSDLVETITHKVAALPVERQHEVLDFVELISQRSEQAPDTDEKESKRPFKSVMGILAHTGMDVTEEDIAEVRREMWKNFPREEPR